MVSTQRVAVVTGAAAGIGAATARRLAQDGVAVFLIDRSPSVVNLRDAFRAEGLRVQAAVMDVSDESAWAEAAQICRATLGRPGILVSNAFVVDVAPIEETPRDSWDRQIGVNLTGAYLAVRTFLDDLRADGAGAIVLVSSVHAHFGLPGRAAYASTKAGLTGLARQLAAEYGPEIRVNSVLPGPILTDAWDGIDDGARAASGRATALGRLGRPEEVADAIAYLCSPGAAYITGVELPVDGGWSITKESS